MIRALEAEHTTAAAEACTRGERCLTVIYGPLDNDEEQADVDALSAQLWALAEDLGGDTSQLLRTLGRGHRTTWWWSSTTDLRADVIARHAEHLVHLRSRSWWRLSQDSE